MIEARTNLAHYFGSYNREQVHQSLDWRTPHEVYFGTQEAAGDPEIADAASTVTVHVLLYRRRLGGCTGGVPPPNEGKMPSRQPARCRRYEKRQ